MNDMTIKEQAEKLIDIFGSPLLAISAVGLLLSELPNTLLDEQETWKFWENVKTELESR